MIAPHELPEARFVLFAVGDPSLSISLVCRAIPARRCCWWMMWILDPSDGLLDHQSTSPTAIYAYVGDAGLQRALQSARLLSPVRHAA